MIISTVVPASQSQVRRRLVTGQDSDTATVGLAPEADAPAATEPAKEVRQEGHVGRIITGIAAVKTANDGATFLIEQANRATPEQIGQFLQSRHLVATPEAAQAEGQRIANAIQDKGVGAVLLGLQAGVATFVIVDAIKPGWSLERKLILAAIAAAAIAAIAYFGINSDAPGPANAVVANKA